MAGTARAAGRRSGASIASLTASDRGIGARFRTGSGIPALTTLTARRGAARATVTAGPCAANIISKNPMRASF